MRFSAETQNRLTGCVFPCDRTEAQPVESVYARKRKRRIVRVSEGTDTASRFWRNPQMRFSVKARKQAKPQPLS